MLISVKISEQFYFTEKNNSGVHLCFNTRRLFTAVLPELEHLSVVIINVFLFDREKKIKVPDLTRQRI